MNVPVLDPVVVIAATCLVGLTVVAAALLRAWQGWLDLKRQELERASGGRRSPDAGTDSPGVGAARIELADLRERIRKLEAIASGVEL